MKRLLILFIGLAMLYTQPIFANDCDGLLANKNMHNICLDITPKLGYPNAKLGLSKKAIAHKQVNFNLPAISHLNHPVDPFASCIGMEIDFDNGQCFQILFLQ